jgi:hypothetical protein
MKTTTKFIYVAFAAVTLAIGTVTQMARSTIYSLPLMAMAKTVGVLFTSTPRLACKAPLLRALITPVGWPLTIPAIYLWQPRRSMAAHITERL